MSTTVHVLSRTLPFGGTPEEAQRRHRLDRLAALRARLAECEWRDPDLLARAAALVMAVGDPLEAVNLLERVLYFDRNNTWARAKLAELCSPEEIREMKLPPPSRSLSSDWTEPFRYPLRGNGAWVIPLGSLMMMMAFMALDWARHYGVGMIFAIPTFLLTCGFMGEYLRRVVRSTAVDGREAPDWPAWDLAQYWLAMQLICVVVVPLSPLFLWLFYAQALAAGAPLLYVGGALLLAMLGVFVLPMMMLIFFMRRSVSDALNPALVFEGIRAAGREYRAAAAIWLGSAFACILITWLGSTVRLFGVASSAPVAVYGLTAGARALGTVYQSSRERFRW